MALKMTKGSLPKAGEAWVAFDEDTKILLAGIENGHYQVALERMRRRIQRNDARFEEGEVGVVAGEMTEHQNHCMLLGHFIVKDWQGVQDTDDNPLDFTPEAAARLLESNVDFFVFVLREAGKISADAREELAETLGKPSPASSGSVSGREKRTKGARSTNA